MGGVVSLETSIKNIELVRLRGGNVHSSWFVPFKTCDVVDALPHASCVVGVELFFNFVFILPFGDFDGFPEIVTGLFSSALTRLIEHRC